MTRAQALVVIVNPTAAVQRLSKGEVLDIFLGRFRTFPSGAVAQPIDLDIASQERAQFYLILAHKDPAYMSGYWGRLSLKGGIPAPVAVPDARAAVDIVAKNPNAIAYVDRTVVEKDKRVRIVLEVTP